MRFSGVRWSTAKKPRMAHSGRMAMLGLWSPCIGYREQRRARSKVGAIWTALPSSVLLQFASWLLGSCRWVSPHFSSPKADCKHYGSTSTSDGGGCRWTQQVVSPPNLQLLPELARANLNMLHALLSGGTCVLQHFLVVPFRSLFVGGQNRASCLQDALWRVLGNPESDARATSCSDNKSLVMINIF